MRLHSARWLRIQRCMNDSLHSELHSSRNPSEDRFAVMWKGPWPSRLGLQLLRSHEQLSSWMRGSARPPQEQVHGTG